jgi:folate-dependent phosphoribosylglycinamide formyltransferase PurN
VTVAVITLRGSRYGLRLLNALARAGQRADVVVVVEDDMARKLRLLRRVARQVGIRDAVLLAIERQRTTGREAKEHTWRGAPLSTAYDELASTVVVVESLRSAGAADVLRSTDVVLLGQSGIVPKTLLELPAVGTLNAHPGALPEYRGLDAPLWAVLNNDFDRVGASLHVVDPGIDTGPVLLRHGYEWRGDETLDELERRIYDDCIDLLLRGVELARSGGFSGEDQGAGKYHGIMPRALRRRAERNLAAFLARRAA